MITLELNKIPGYSLDASKFVTMHFASGASYSTCLTMDALGLVESDKPEVKEEVHKVTETTLLKAIAMIHGVKEIPK